MAQRRGQWSVVVVNGVVAGAVMALVAVLALVVNPPAPPGISAFAPQATKPITKAPPGQASQSGDGPGACAAGQVCATPTPTSSARASAGPSAAPTASKPPRGVPSALQCYTWPDGTVTQTFDPQSPPCIATWDSAKGNGGATSPGVTPTEIRVALPVTSTASTWPSLKPVVDFVNSRFQLYGRQIRIVPFASQQATEQSQGTFNSPVAQRADASAVTQLKAFAALDFVDPLQYSWSLPVYRDVLTRNRIVSVAGGETTPFGTAQGMAKAAPYEWTYYPTIDTLIDSVATMTCRQLVRRAAVHAPDASYRQKQRKLAVLIPKDELLGGPMPGLRNLQRTLAGCGVSDLPVVTYGYGANERAALAANFRTLADDGVTTLLHFPFAGDATTSPMGIAAQVNYRPEWVLIGANNYLSMFQLNNPQTETSGAFGVGVWNKMPQLELEMWVQSFLAGGGDQALVQSGSMPSARAFYQEMLLLASGIQLAGPTLTPATFAAGLRETRFPNPGAGRAPSYQATVGFGPSDVAMTEDYNAFWLDTRTSGQEVSNSKNINTHRAACYVGLGRRWTADGWPTTDGYYTPGCR